MNISLPVPNEIEKSLRDFKADYPYPEKVGLIMMRFSDTETQHNIIKAIKEAARTHGIEALRADERTYNSLLVLNVKTYMWGCGFGFAVFDHISSKDEKYNPNVAFEVGYMHALQKRICLLKDASLRSLHSDLGGKIYYSFDAQDLEASRRGLTCGGGAKVKVVETAAPPAVSNKRGNDGGESIRNGGAPSHRRR